ncbi:hypothetical protein GV236_07255 [Streptococcus pneumoniae]|nr:hypothetical protein [Streptococcus pneumoniae]TVW04736.1 hypothetical protein AZK13_04920 [Streptococcus pneumoniae]
MYHETELATRKGNFSFFKIFLKKQSIINHNQRRECMSNYRRTSKPKTEHIKKGFTVFQKTITTIGSILGLITAGITIMNALDNNNKNTKKEPTTSQTTTFVKEIQKESPQENTTPNKENNTSQEKTQQEETPKSSVKEEKKEDQKTATQDSTTPATSKPATENEKQPNTPTSENNTQ